MYRLSQVIAYRDRHVGMEAEPRDAQLGRQASLAVRPGSGIAIVEARLLWPLVALWLAITGGGGLNAEAESDQMTVAERREPCLQTEPCERGCATAA